MHKINKSKAPKRERNGLTSFILLQQPDNLSNKLAITWVEVEINAKQTIHHHDPEQVYVIIQGQGIMTVNNETEKVSVGDMIFIPSNHPHGLQNTGKEKLVYISASSPSFNIQKAYDDGLSR